VVSADPTDQVSIDMLSRVLATRVADDPELVRQLQQLVADAPEAVTARDQAQVGMIISGSLIGGRADSVPPAVMAARHSAGCGGRWRQHLPCTAAKPPSVVVGGGGGGVIPIIREDGPVKLIGRPGSGGPGGASSQHRKLMT